MIKKIYNIIEELEEWQELVEEENYGSNKEFWLSLMGFGTRKSLIN